MLVAGGVLILKLISIRFDAVLNVNIKTLVFVLKVIDDVFSFLFRVLELLRKD